MLILSKYKLVLKNLTNVSFKLFTCDDQLMKHSGVQMLDLTVAAAFINLMRCFSWFLPSPSMWCFLCFEPSTGSYLMSQNPWRWKSRGSATWLSRLWLKTRMLCWWVEAKGPTLPLQALPAQVSWAWDTHTHTSTLVILFRNNILITPYNPQIPSLCYCL